MHEETPHHPPKISLHRSGVAAGNPAKPSVSVMQQVRDNLMFSLKELQRMDDEGGSDVTPQQTDEIEKLSESLRRINALMPLPSQNQDSDSANIPNYQPKEKRDE